jgi:glyoxalase family protein
MSLVTGLHHVTACVEGAQEDIDLYTKLLGVKLVKQTVLLDGGTPIYHLYYADAIGSAGTVMTSFPFAGRRRGRRGSGQVAAASYSVPSGSLEAWEKRLKRAAISAASIKERFGQRYLRFWHPGGIGLELIEADADERTPLLTDGIGPDHAVRGIHSVTLSLRDVDESAHFVSELGFRKVASEGPWTRFDVGPGGAGATVDFLHEPDAPAGTTTYAAGTYHHVAFNVQRESHHQLIKDHLDGFGWIDMSEIKDRNYFRSSYIRMPGGVLFELATSDPQGFAKDEPIEALGQHLKLPAWKLDDEADILAALEPISTGAGDARVAAS